MKYYSESITNLIEELASLPNIGPKSAQRLAPVSYTHLTLPTNLFV